MSDSIIYGCGGGPSGETTCGNIVVTPNGGSGGSASGGAVRAGSTVGSWATSSNSITIPSTTSVLIGGSEIRETKMNCGVQYDCVVPSYGYPGFNILESCIGLGLLVLAAALGYYIYRRACNYYDVTGLVQDKE